MTPLDESPQRGPVRANGVPFLMPPPAPMAMPVQDFRDHPAFRCPGPAAPGGGRLLRLAAFGPAVAVVLAFVLWVAWSVARGGAGPADGALLAIIGAGFAWATLSVSAVTLALWQRARARPRDPVPPAWGRPLDVALLVPIRNETAADVMGNIAAMRAELARDPGPGRFAFFVLSDTEDPAIAADEARLVVHLRAEDAPAIPVHYRRRPANIDRKIGNLRDWITRWGGAWELMIVLDADSLMSGRAITRLRDAMACDPTAGLIQSFPVPIAAETLFGRMQTFAAGAYGWLTAEGQALWSRSEGNHWGHNAIIRTRAFAESAGLPHLRRRTGAPQLLLSHDFVEAGLLRRAGWSVRFLPEPDGSYEEPPATLIDHLLRDRRWCRGNMQHLRLLSARGFHPVSRFHLAQGAAAYLFSPIWLAFLLLWMMVTPVPGATDPMRAGPVQAAGIVGGWWILLSLFALLLFPKLVAVGLMLRDRATVRLYGSAGTFIATVLTEIVLSALYAPILMVQQSLAVLRALPGRHDGWAPQRRGPVRHSWLTLVRFHWLEVALGACLCVGIVAGTVSPWLSLVTLSLVAAPGLSWLSGLRVAGRGPSPLRLDAPSDRVAPAVLHAALAERARLRRFLAADAPACPAIAAE